MEALTNRVKPVDRRKMSVWERMYLPAVFKGMAITIKHFFKKKATINYPEQTRPFSPVFRGLQILNRDEEGRENCTACGLCEVACPKDAVYLSETFAPANYQRKGFIYGKQDLLIPDPKTDPEGFARAKGSRIKNPQGHGNEH